MIWNQILPQNRFSGESPDPARISIKASGETLSRDVSCVWIPHILYSDI
jgi:hypothetical protein